MIAYGSPSTGQTLRNESPQPLWEVGVISTLWVLKLKVKMLDIWPTKSSTPSCLFRATKLQCVLILVIPSTGAQHLGVMH